VSCDTKEAKAKVKKKVQHGEARRRRASHRWQWRRRCRVRIRAEEEGETVAKARKVTKKMMVGLNTRDGEGIGRNLKKMAGGHGFE
jgi:hypothetical protein